MIQRKRFACWITKPTDTVRICNIFAFQRQKNVTRIRLSVRLHLRTFPALLQLKVLRIACEDALLDIRGHYSSSIQPPALL